MPRYNYSFGGERPDSPFKKTVKQGISPYYVPSKSNSQSQSQPEGLFTRIKAFFQNKPKQQQKPKRNTKQPTAFENVSIGNIDLSMNSNMSFTSKNPNDTLSEFFQKKGDTPLNEIEIEGVMSLIRKSQSNLPSRNGSMINHSLFTNNSQMGSKVGGLASFNDANNSTILRAPSADLKKPVTIKTPTYKSKLVQSNTNTSLNRSFNLNGIRKRRIVSYTSPLNKVETKSISPLCAFLEKKKTLSKKKNDSKDYKGGIIDLSKFSDDDDDDDDAHGEGFIGDEAGKNIGVSRNGTTEEISKSSISKTASKVLDILDGEQNVIITINDELKENNHDDKQIVHDKTQLLSESKTNNKKDKNQTVLESRSDKKSSATPVFPFKPMRELPLFKDDAESAKTEIHKEGTKEYEPYFASTSSSTKSKLLQTKQIPEVPVTTSEKVDNSRVEPSTMKSQIRVPNVHEENENLDLSVTKPSFDFSIPKNDASKSPFSFSFSGDTISNSLSSEKTQNVQLEKKPAESGDIEVIDSFVFPEIPNKEPTKVASKLPPSQHTCDFIFPVVSSVDPSLLTKIMNASNEYDEVFTF